jgi:hypothetical protein
MSEQLNSVLDLASNISEGLVSPELRERRSLTDVEHLYNAMDPDGNIPEGVKYDIQTNRKTTAYELSMPLAISVILRPVEYRTTGEGRRKRVITWMGRDAVAAAFSGYDYHWSPEARKRVDIEVPEARRAQENIIPGVAQTFISPKMTTYDASSEVAKSEHLYEDDSLRVSYPVCNSKGEVVAMRLESLLVRDIPLEAWTNMLKDPNNIFGKAFYIDNEQSALSVMKLFDQLDLPENVITRGPVTLVEAVLPYITDESKKASVARQLEGFKCDQEKYEIQAEKTAQEWLNFDIELARSLRNGQATSEIENFIVGLQHEWSEDNLKIINNHNFNFGNRTGFIMTRQFAALLEDAKAQTLNTIAGVLTGNERMINQIDPISLRHVQETQQYLDILRANSASFYAIRQIQAELERTVAGYNIEVKGGCPGSIKNNFRGPGELEVGQSEASGADSGGDEGTCEFISETCPECSKKKVKTKVETVTVNGSKKKRITGSCGCSVIR